MNQARAIEAYEVLYSRWGTEDFETATGELNCMINDGEITAEEAAEAWRLLEEHYHR